MIKSENGAIVVEDDPVTVTADLLVILLYFMKYKPILLTTAIDEITKNSDKLLGDVWEDLDNG